MRYSFVTASLASVASVYGAALPQQDTSPNLAPALPSSAYTNTPMKIQPKPLIAEAAKYKNVTGLQLQDVVDATNTVLPGAQVVQTVAEAITSTIQNITDLANTLTNLIPREVLERGDVFEPRGNCQNPRVRVEWDFMSDSDKQSWISAIQCLQNSPSDGQWPNSRSRYEDFVALHQHLTPNVHGNSKFLVWHRYFTWTFEDILRSECGFNTAFPWWDETRYAGNFGGSSVFSSNYLGTSNSGGGCVTDGRFGSLTLDVGPGTDYDYNPHCLQRETDESATANVNTAYVNQCYAWGDFANMAACVEGGPHAWGHNGIGGVMGDMYCSPGDPSFWLHHAFVDRLWRIWQNMDSSRLTTIDGTDVSGNQLNLGMSVNVWDMRPTVTIGQIMDTTDETLCYKYNY